MPINIIPSYKLLVMCMKIRENQIQEHSRTSSQIQEHSRVLEWKNQIQEHSRLSAPCANPGFDRKIWSDHPSKPCYYLPWGLTRATDAGASKSQQVDQPLSMTMYKPRPWCIYILFQVSATSASVDAKRFASQQHRPCPGPGLGLDGNTSTYWNIYAVIALLYLNQNAVSHGTITNLDYYTLTVHCRWWCTLKLWMNNLAVWTRDQEVCLD